MFYADLTPPCDKHKPFRPPLNQFLRMVGQTFFYTLCLDRSHFKTTEDKLLIFGGLIININSSKKKL